MAHNSQLTSCASAFLTHNLASRAGSTAGSPILGIANLACGVLNLGLAGYNTYQLRSISKLQKVTYTSSSTGVCPELVCRAEAVVATHTRSYA